MSGPLKARLVKAIGTAASLRVLWLGPCPSPGAGAHHVAELEVGRTEVLHCSDVGGTWGQHEDRFPKACAACGAAAPPEAVRALARRTLYDTESGRPEPGDIYEAPWMHLADCAWENCDGRHFNVVLPNGHAWHLQGRASNCDQREDFAHRCWVVHGTAPDLHVDKQGVTCGAGAGSVIGGGWHGFLHHGYLVPC